eukprot:CAMPEP_0202345090 /NCGR_PEP_ID=MMETSP1126-20121109/4476_1 /ASSEMBLY_ACC=CAM_ASM_000457 /TAXON_ID=3047 /ORGANISM="Dunaliella tertiolecta, Strain CCMP1320" /LENGTH=549 /DNA_ID=CAMNT_0048936341 /DNA_START=235 /DNA_END=1885 /DNA_ORIENTATION=+
MLTSSTAGRGSEESAQRPSVQQQTPSWMLPKVTLSVEGNISVGKSTFLNHLQASSVLEGKLQIVPEPVAKWQCVGEGQVNLLMEFYKAPERFAYTFQNYVFLTRVVQERESYIAPEPCRLLERSIFCDRMVFVRACHAAKFMNDTELSIYDAWFDPVLNTLPTLVPNGFVYLRAQPEVCHQRLQRRARQEETTVQLEYLQELHQCHEDWLFHGGEAVTTTSSTQLYIWVGLAEQVLQGTGRATPPPNSAAPSASSSSPFNPKISYAIRNHLPGPELTDVVALQVPKVPRRLSGAIRFIDANRAHIHPLLDTIPSLILDCNNEVDVEHDEQYKAYVSGMVEEFSEYVRAYVLARGDARLALGEHLAAKAEAKAKAEGGGASASSGAAPAEPVAVPLPSNFNGYSVDVRGTTLYVEPEAPLLAHAATRATQKRSRKGRVYFPSTPRTQQQQQKEEAQRAQQEGRDAEEEEEEDADEERAGGAQVLQQQYGISSSSSSSSRNSKKMCSGGPVRCPASAINAKELNFLQSMFSHSVFAIDVEALYICCCCAPI